MAPSLNLTARLNTAAVDSRRGVVRLHAEAVAALGIREWDAVSLTGSRTTAAVAGLAGPGVPAGTVLLDDVTLSNAGLREDTPVTVTPVTVYGAKVGDAQRIEPGPPIGVDGNTANGAAGQGDDDRRHGIAVAARPGPGHLDVEGQRCAGIVGRHHVDVRTADRHRRGPDRAGQRATELVGHLGRRPPQPHSRPPLPRPARRRSASTT